MTESVTIGNATLYRGDCREVLPTLADIDTVLTDPPYGVGLDYGTFQDTQENVRALAAEWLPAARGVAKRVCFTPGVINQWLYPQPTWVLGWFIGGGGSAGFWGFGMWQPILCYGPDPFLEAGKGRRPDTIYTALASTGVDKSVHPCPKPLHVWSRVIDRCSVEGVVCDPFLGSGTTGVACAKLGRKFIGIELEPRFFDVACKRVEDAQRQADMFASVNDNQPAPEQMALGVYK